MQRIQLYPQQLLSLGCALAVACGGPEPGEGAEGALEQAEAAATTTGCGGVLLEYDALRSRHQDPLTQRIRAHLSWDLIVALMDCTMAPTRHVVRSCFDDPLDRHYESHFCTVKRDDGGLRDTIEREVFGFSVGPVAGADARPLYRCVLDGRDMVTRIPTCGVWNVAPVYELGYSFARTTPGVSEVFRCRRAVSPADIFMSRDPACGGHVREASYGFAR